MTPEQKVALESHIEWLNGNPSETRCALPNQDWTGEDFTSYNFEKIDLRRSNFTNCIMPKNCKGAILSTISGTNIDFSTNKSDISNSSFDAANIEGCNFVGAMWNGVEITDVSPVLITDLWWTWCTNAFAQIGCTQRTIADWEAIGASLDSVTSTYAGNSNVNPQETYDWWNANKQTIRDWYAI